MSNGAGEGARAKLRAGGTIGRSGWELGWRPVARLCYRLAVRIGPRLPAGCADVRLFEPARRCADETSFLVPLASHPLGGLDTPPRQGRGQPRRG